MLNVIKDWHSSRMNEISEIKGTLRTIRIDVFSILFVLGTTYSERSVSRLKKALASTNARVTREMIVMSTAAKVTVYHPLGVGIYHMPYGHYTLMCCTAYICRTTSGDARRGGRGEVHVGPWAAT